MAFAVFVVQSTCGDVLIGPWTTDHVFVLGEASQFPALQLVNLACELCDTLIRYAWRTRQTSHAKSCSCWWHPLGEHLLA